MTTHSLMTIDQSLPDGRRLHGFALIGHDVIKGDRQTRISNVMLRIDDGPDLMIKGSQIVLTNKNYVMADKSLMDLWIDSRYEEICRCC